MWRMLLLAFAALGLLTLPVAPAAATETPLVPILSAFHHWDHHWYIWLPGDPVFEAVEVMATDRGPGAEPLVWVFFTERAPPKHQIHYFNDARIALAAGAQARDIAFTMTGLEGGPRGVSVSLLDFKRRPIVIDVRFGAEVRLTTTGAGLTNQIGHSGDRMLLVFFRERNAFAEAWHVAIAGTDVAMPQPGQNGPAPFPAAYSSNIFVGSFPFGIQRVAVGAPRAGEAKDIEHFAPSAPRGGFEAVLTDGSRINLVAAPDGRLQSYRHAAGEHGLEIGFDPPLPAADRLKDAVDSTYRISLDGFRDLLTGTVHAARQGDTIILDWQFAAPDWTRTHALRTTATLNLGEIARVELRPLPLSQ